MNTWLLWVILITAVLTAILAVVQFIRTTNDSQAIGKELRDELRTAREENRSAGKELREEVADGLKGTSDTLTSSPWQKWHILSRNSQECSGKDRLRNRFGSGDDRKRALHSGSRAVTG